jgi:hypothetical protein
MDRTKLIKNEIISGKKGFLKEDRNKNKTQQESWSNIINKCQPVQPQITSIAPPLTLIIEAWLTGLNPKYQRKKVANLAEITVRKLSFILLPAIPIIALVNGRKMDDILRKISSCLNCLSPLKPVIKVI